MSKTGKKLNYSEQEKNEKIEALRFAATEYARSDQLLEVACNRNHVDPIACTVYALKNRHIETIPKESVDAAKGLSKVVSIHGELVVEFGMDSDIVRQIWFPILNSHEQL